MLKALLALLLLRADASSYGFSVAWNSDSSLVHHARGYAANVVNISMNDLTTMRNTEVLCPSMDNLSTHTHDGNRALLTTPLHASQLEEVHPRGPAVLTNMPDNNTNTTGQNPLSTTDDQPPRLDHDTSHYTNTNTNAICVVTTFYSKSNDTGDGHNEDHNTEPPPSAICAVLDAVINEYQYYVHKPPPDARSRRRERYELRIAQLTSRPGPRKKRCRLGSPGTSNCNKTVNNNNSAKSENTTGKCMTAAVLLYCLLLICTVAAAYLEYMARRYNMCTDIVYATSLAYNVTVTALLYASVSIAALLISVWTMPALAAVLTALAAMLTVARRLARVALPASF